MLMGHKPLFLGHQLMLMTFHDFIFEEDIHRNHVLTGSQIPFASNTPVNKSKPKDLKSNTWWPPAHIDF